MSSSSAWSPQGVPGHPKPFCLRINTYFLQDLSEPLTVSKPLASILHERSYTCWPNTGALWVTRLPPFFAFEFTLNGADSNRTPDVPFAALKMVHLSLGEREGINSTEQSSFLQDLPLIGGQPHSGPQDQCVSMGGRPEKREHTAVGFYFGPRGTMCS